MRHIQALRPAACTVSNMDVLDCRHLPLKDEARRKTNSMIEIEALTGLLGCTLRSPIAPVLERLGPPDQTDFSPVDPSGCRFGNYLWRRTLPPLAVLTYLSGADRGEFVWGIRILGDGPFDHELGFGVGSFRAHVALRCPAAIDSSAESIVQVLLDGRLTVFFRGDVVREIQLLAPMEAADSS